MNKYFFLLISLLTVTLIIFTNLYYGKTSSNQVLRSLEQELKLSTTNSLQAITPTIRNLLVQGNIREARTVLEGWKKNMVFAGYQILEEGKIIDSNLANLDPSEKSYFQITVPIKYSHNGPIWGEIRYYKSFTQLKSISSQIENGFDQILLYTSLFLISITFFIFILIWLSTDRLTKFFGEYLKDAEQRSTSSLLRLIWGPMISRIDDMAEVSKLWRQKYIEAEKAQAMTKVCRQVSHDIRSPLAALNMALDDMDKVPELTRQILRMSIQRIQDIANNLLIDTNTPKENIELAPTLLQATLDEILSEKRLQYKSKMSLQIKGDLSKGLGLFSLINSSLLKQVISNVINNSIEAMPSEEGKITLSLEKSEEMISISIQDSGKGMSPETLSQIGKKEFSFGKETLSHSGFGIGLQHAFETVAEWGGKIEIDSKIGLGTSVRILLPKCECPDWFLSQLDLDSGSTLVILDDDHEIHQVWESKLKKHIEENIVSIIHFSAVEEMKSWFSLNKERNFLLLTDQELIGSEGTGLDLIKELQIIDKSVLVTSHYDEIQKTVKEPGLKIIPKMIVSNISVTVKAKDIHNVPLQL
jgi:signal transduction histidine kinase